MIVLDVSVICKIQHQAPAYGMSGSYSDTLKLTPRPPIRTELSHHMTMLSQSRVRVQVM